MAVERFYHSHKASPGKARDGLRPCLDSRNLQLPGGVMARVRGLAFLAVVAILALAAVGSAASGPRPLRGVPIHGETGLRLLVASNPPYVLDVDSGRVTPVTGIPASPHDVLWVRPAGRDALVILDRLRPQRKLPVQEIYLVRRGTTSAKLLGTGWGVAPSADEQAVWISSYGGARRCKLREVNLGGKQRRAGRSFPCGWLDPGGSLGLILHRRTRDELVDPSSLRTLLHAPQILAVASGRVLTEDRAKGLTLIDMPTGKRQSLPWPSAVGGGTSQGGTENATVDASGKLLALGFSDPAYQGDGTQVTDVWLLDTETGGLRHLPDMPAIVSLKFTSWTWTTSGQLVFLAETEGANVVGVWKPDDLRIAVKRVKLPERNSGSDSFVPW